MSTHVNVLLEPVAPITEQVLILEAGRADKHYWTDLWRYRELFFILAWRDVSVRYKQTIIGVLWAILRPSATMIGSPSALRRGRARAGPGRAAAGRGAGEEDRGEVASG